MPQFKYNELLTLSRPWQDLVVNDPDGLKNHAAVFSILFRHEKHTLATQIVMECPRKHIPHLRSLASELALNYKKNEFYTILKNATLSAELIFNLMNPDFCAPHLLFLDKNMVAENQALLKSSAWFYKRILQDEKTLNAIAYNLLFQTPCSDAPSLIKNLHSAFVGTGLAERIKDAFKVDRMLYRMTVENPVDILLDKEFDPGVVQLFPGIIKMRLEGFERNIACSIMDAGPEQFTRVKKIISPLTDNKNNPNNCFDLIQFFIVHMAQLRQDSYAKNRHSFHSAKLEDTSSAYSTDRYASCILS